MKVKRNGKFRRNKMVVYCSVIFITLLISSVCSYLIIPDNTENANNQNPLIALKPPGFSQKFILRYNNINHTEKSILDIFFHGINDELEEIPYDSYKIVADNISIKYAAAVRQTKLVDIIEKIDVLDKTERIGRFITYTNIDGKSNTLQVTEVTEKFNKKHLTKKTFWLGTDKFGRDNLSRLILGLRISLLIGFLAVVISITVGTVIGSLGGYYGRWIDRIIMLVINTSWSIPTLLLAFAIIIAFGKGLTVIFLAVGLTMWVDVARIVRGQVMQIKNELYVTSSKVLGLGDLNTITRHILPNILGPLLVIAAANFATAILVESGLSYLGLGVQPPTPSLGNLLKENYAYATGGFIYLAAFPIVAIMVLVLNFNLLGTALRDVYDVKRK